MAQPTLVAAQNAGSTPPVVPEAGGPSLDTAINGVGVVNIVAPTASGLSHNRYEHFNVPEQGLILNNSPTAGVSRLGGALVGNPNLTTGSASTILNEVTSNHASSLLGALEVHGAAADVIIANPNGITCNGCEFINTPSITLSTGIPEIEAGQLQALTVNRGTVTVEELGLDASASETEILSRVSHILGAIHAERLRVVTGRNRVAGEIITKLPPSDDTPLFAVDAADIGAPVRAGSIRLIATEAGLGVRIADEMRALLGPVEITADGRITHSPIIAPDSVDLESLTGGIVGTGPISAGGDITLTAAEGILQSGERIAALGDVRITAPRLELQATQLAAGMDDDSLLHASGAMALVLEEDLATSDSLVLSGSTLAITAARIEAASDEGPGIQAGTDLTLRDANGALVLTGALLAGRDVIAESAGDLTQESLLEAGRDARVTTTGAFIQTQDARLAATGEALLDIGGTATNAGEVTAEKAVSLEATQITNSGVLAGGTQVTLTAPGDITNTGLVYSEDRLTVRGDAAVRNEAATILSEGDLLFEGVRAETALARLENVSGTIESVAGDVDIHAASLENRRAELTVETVVIAEGIPGGGSLEDYASSQGLTPPDPADYQDRPDEPSYYERDLGNFWADVLDLYGGGDGNSVGIPTEKTVSSTSSTIIEDQVVSAAPASSLLAGGDMTLTVVNLRNAHSTIASNGDMTLTGETLSQEGVTLTRTTTTHVNETVYIPCTSRQYYEVGCADTPADGYQGTQTRQSTNVTTEVIGSVPVALRASGTLTGSFEDRIDNESVVENADPAAIQGVAALDEALPELGSAGTLQTVGQAPIPLLPSGDAALFSVDLGDGPAPRYIVETNKAFTQAQNYVGTDYFLSRIGYDVGDTALLGDPYYESRLIRQQIQAATGNTSLASLRGNTGGALSDPDQFIALMDNALTQGGALDLTPTIALSAAQVAALGTDIVWPVAMEIDGRIVLVPVLYLARAGPETIQVTSDGGARIAASEVQLTAANAFVNSLGRMEGESIVAEVTDGALLNAYGTLSAAEDLTLDVQQDITVRGGRVEAGGNATLTAGGDVALITETARSGSIAFGRNAAHGGGGQMRAVGTSERAGRQAVLDAGQTLTITAGGNLQARGAAIEAGEDVTVQTDGTIVLEALQSDTASLASGVGRARTFEGLNLTTSADGVIRRTQSQETTVSAGRDLTLDAQGAILTEGTRITAGEDASLQAGTDITLLASAEREQRTVGYRPPGGSRLFSDAVTRQGTQITAGSTLDLSAGNRLTSEGAALEAGDTLTLTAVGDVALGARQESSDSARGMGKGIIRSETIRTPLPTELDAGGDITIQSLLGTVSLQAPVVRTDGTLSLSAPLGEVALTSLREIHFWQEVGTHDNGLRVTMTDRGAHTETVRLPDIEAQGGIDITAQSVLADIRVTPGQSLDEAADLLAREPGLEWIAAVQAQDAVTWQAVSNMYEEWDHSSSSISPTAAAIIAITAAAIIGPQVGQLIVTQAGAGSALTVTVGGELALSSLGTAMSTGITSLATGSITQAVNGAVGGDVDMASVFETALVSAVTAGLSQAVSTELLELADLANTSFNVDVSDALLGELITRGSNAVISSAITSAVRGEDFAETFRGSAIAAGAQTAMAVGQFYIGEMGEALSLNEGDVFKAIAHGAVGGLAAEAQGGDFEAGAAAGIAQELATLGLSTTDPVTGATVQQIVGGLAGALAGGGDPTNINLGAQIAASGYQYNYLHHAEALERAIAREQCESGSQSSCDRAAELDRLDLARDQYLKQVCGSGGDQGACFVATTDLLAALSSYHIEPREQYDSPEAYSAALADVAYQELLREYIQSDALVNDVLGDNPEASALYDTLLSAYNVDNTDAWVRFVQGIGNAGAETVRGVHELTLALADDPARLVDVVAAIADDPTLLWEGIKEPYEERIAVGDYAGAVGYAVIGLVEAAVATKGAVAVATNTGDAAQDLVQTLRNASATNRTLPNYSTSQLQHEFKHAGDFGVTGNWNKSNGETFKTAINNHIKDPATQVIQGSYRNQPATLYYNSNTGNVSFNRSDGSFWGAWKLSPAQAQNVTTHGSLQ